LRNAIDTHYRKTKGNNWLWDATQKYYQIVELLQWLGVDARQFLYGIDGFRQQKEGIDML